MIDIIDRYYASIDTTSDVQKMTFINEYRRLMESMIALWKALEIKGTLPPFERLYVSALLDREVTGRGNCDPALLYKMNQYTLVL